ncbi:unnamed protein product [Camellia sinensis]
MYQRHNKEVNIWSTVVSGVNVPVAPYNGVALSQGQADGTVMLTIKIEGRVRFEVGTYISGCYHLSVKCPDNIVFGNPHCRRRCRQQYQVPAGPELHRFSLIPFLNAL